MKILMFGRGAIAMLYGWAFRRAGHTVEYFVRPGRSKEYGQALQVHILDARRKLQGTWVSEVMPTPLHESLPPGHDFNLIIVSVQHYNFASAAEYLAPRCGNATILIFNNFWAEPMVAAAALPADRLVWGFPAAGGGFPGGSFRGALLKTVRLGASDTSASARELQVRDLFQQSGFQTQEIRDFRGWLLIHFVINGGLHAENLLAGSATQVMRSGTHRRNAIRTMRELLPLLAARGVDLKAHAAEASIIRLPPWVGAMVLWLAWKLSRPVRVVIESHTMPNDLFGTCRDLLQFAQRQDIPTPRVALAVQRARASGRFPNC